MLCCLLAALLSGNIAVVGRIAVGFVRRPNATRFMLVGVFAAAGALLTPAAIAHVGHYAERASLNERSLLEEILAAPICSGSGQHGIER